MSKINVYYSLNAKELERQKKHMVEEAINCVGEEDQKKDDVRTIETVGEFDIDVCDGIILMISSEFGFISIAIDDINSFINIVEAIKDRRNELNKSFDELEGAE